MKRRILSQYLIHDMELTYLMDEGGTVGIQLIPAACAELVCQERKYRLEPLIQVKLAEDAGPFGFSQGRTMRNSASAAALVYVGQEKLEREIVTELQDKRGYAYFHHILWQESCDALECYAVMENRSGKAVAVEMISSFTLGAITPFAEGIAEETLIFHRLRSTWSAEGRLVSEPVEELQLEPSWQNCSANCLRFGQVGSMPVRQFAPFAAVEDTKAGVTWAVSLTLGSSWQLEAYRRDASLTLSGGIADREFGHWLKVLKPGERMETPKAVLTAAAGGVSHAAQRLTENMREHLSLPESEKGLPLIFNEFCTTWGCPDEAMIRRMADKLKDRGITYFVIDAGWYDDEAFDVHVRMGDWESNPKRFPNGMKAAADLIRERGMIPGIWFEFEISGMDSATSRMVDHLLTRDGIPVTSGKRRFFDMRQEWVQEYLSGKVIRFLRENGFGYIKVDYNETIGIGCDGDDSLGEGLRQQILAVQQFFARIHQELPEVVIEVCSSGGHRLVPSFMELASMASFSDAHECDEIPIIAANMHRMILPRQSQIWAVLKADNPLKKFYYQMASSFLGRCCISGDIETLSTEQWAVVEAGFAFYKRIAGVIDRGETRYCGSHILSYRKPKGWQGIVRENAAGTGKMAVVHTFHEAPETIRLEMGTGVRIEAVYARSGIEVHVEGEMLVIQGLETFDGLGVWMRSESESGKR